MEVPGRAKTPIAVGEMDSLRAFLDFHRATLLWKVGGLSREELSRPLTPSGTNLLGMVKHLAYVERYWFGIFFAGLDLPMPGSDEDPDADWRIEPDETTEDILALYDGECDRSRAIVTGASSLDELAEHPRQRGWKLSRRWILIHMIEETARHVGHADILREQLDGATGE